jgi:hypothetical protein
MRLPRFVDLTDSLFGRAEPFKPGQLEWALPGVYPDAEPEAMVALTELEVSSIEFLPFAEPTFAQGARVGDDDLLPLAPPRRTPQAIARLLDGSHYRLPFDTPLDQMVCCWEMVSGAHNTQGEWAAAINTALRSWMANNRLVFSPDETGVWRFSRKKPAGKKTDESLLPHPEAWVLSEQGKAEGPAMNISTSTFTPWAAHMAEGFAASLVPLLPRAARERAMEARALRLGKPEADPEPASSPTLIDRIEQAFPERLRAQAFAASQAESLREALSAPAQSSPAGRPDNVAVAPRPRRAGRL